MPPKVQNGAMIDIVDIASSDEEENPNTPSQTVPRQQQNSARTPSQNVLRQQQNNARTPPQNVPRQQQNNASDCRSFWKAGNYEIGRTLMRSADEGQLEHARVHPKFLHSNATSHKWAFGAIAELMDNAVDEIQNGATFLKVDKIDVMGDNAPALLFHDDGGGMDPDGIRKCMSLGYSSKKSNTTIGQYGNGFKTSTMRLGADVIVFSRATRESKATQSIGLLSYTFLRKTGQDDVIVPMVDFDLSGPFVEPIIYSSQDDWSANLKTILEWSPFTTKENLLQQFEDIGSHGTKVIIYNLWLNDEGIYELSFDDDDEDIRLRDEANRGQTKLHRKIVDLQSHLSYRLRYSLRAYASILYLRKFSNFKILLRGKPVEQINIGDELKYSVVVPYKPQLGSSLRSNEVIVETKIGFIKEAPDVNICGYNVYHKNRLIRPYWKVIGEGSSKGNGVVGVLEANFIEPAHDKQDFERSSLFIRLEARLKQILMEYWKGHCHLVGYKPLDKAQDVQAWRAAKIQKQTANQRKEKPISLPASVPQDSSSGQFRNGSEVDLPVQPNAMEAEFYDQTVAKDNSLSKSVEELCDENIELFLRCENEKQKETELQHTVEELEKELAQAKLKHAQLLQHVEARRKSKGCLAQS